MERSLLFGLNEAQKIPWLFKALNLFFLPSGRKENKKGERDRLLLLFL
jgi:hypothetical protein